MKLLLRILTLLLALFGHAIPAGASIIHFETAISGAWDSVFLGFPMSGTGSTATGFMSMDYDTVSNLAFNINVSVTGITIPELIEDQVNWSHVHEPNGVARIIDVGSLGFTSTGTGFELVGGQATVDQALEALLLNETGWINIHTLAFTAGEIAGRLKITPIPVPAAAWLFTSGLIGLIGIARKRKAI